MKDKNNAENNKDNLKNDISSENKKNSNNTHKKSSKKSIREIDILENKDREIKIGNYLIKKTLGKGTFGKVKLGIFLPKNKKVAVKILEKRRLKEEDDIIRLKREFDMLSQFNHPNVISVSEIFETNDAYFTVMEYCEGGELFNYIVENKRLSEEKSAFFYYQLINGLEYIHSLGIVHRDLKPENLLLTEDHVLKIIDFGLSNYFKQEQNELLETPCGSPCYASPEMLSGENYDGFKIDIWATGIILFAMLCGFLPFDHKDNDKLFLKILECKIQYPKEMGKEAKDLIKRILVPDPRKRITIEEIKKHPFYLKGQDIFEKNFSVYQISQNENSESDDSSSFKYYTFEHNYLFYEFYHKSEILFNKYRLFYFNHLRRNNSCKIKNIFSKPSNKKLLNFEKYIKKMKIKIKKDNNNNNKNKKDYEIKEEKFLNRNITAFFPIKDICTYCENLINKYKKEEEIRKNRKLLQNKLIKNKKNNSNKNNQNKNTKNSKIPQKIDINKIILDNDKNNNIENNFEKIKDLKSKLGKILDLNKEKETKLTLNNDLILNKEQYKNKTINVKNPPNKKYNLKKQFDQNIKVNKKIREQINTNDLFINNNKILRTNKLPQNIKLKKNNRKIKSTNNNNSKMKNFQNLIDIINQQTLKPKINIINKQNIIHHHTTNIMNMTQKNFFSNVIINNYKRDEHKNYSSSHNKEKKLLDLSEIQNENEKSLINEYLQKNLEKLNIQKNNNLKFKNNLQKIILKEDMLFTNNNKNNTKNINNLGFKDYEKQQNYLTVRDKKNSQIKENKERNTICTTNDQLRNRYKARIPNINNYNLNNNKKYINNKENSLNSIGFSLISSNNFDLMNDSKRERDNRYISNYININNNINNNGSKNNSVEKSTFNIQNNLYKKKKFDKILNNNINLKLNLDKNKINNSLVENNYSNRSYNYNYNKNTFNKININSNTLENNTNNNLDNNFNINKFSANKKIENIKKNNLYFKNLNERKYPKLNLKQLLGIDNTKKKEIISIQNNYQKQIELHRNKPSITCKTHKNIDINNYLNSVRNNESKISNTINNIGNKGIGNSFINQNANQNLISNLGKYNTNQNNMRNRDIININLNLNYNRIKKNNNDLINMTSDNIKMNSNLVNKKNSLYNYQNININSINNLNKTNNNIQNKTIYNKNRFNTNIFLDKYMESKKLFSSLRKRINFKSNIVNNNYIDKKNQNNSYNNNSIKIKEVDGGGLKTKTLIANYNTKQFKNFNTIDNKNILNFNSFMNLNNNHKKIKSMKDAINIQKNKKSLKKINNNSKTINVDNNNKIKTGRMLNNNNINLNDMDLYISNTVANTNNINNYNNVNILENQFNSIDSYQNRNQYKNININNLKKNNIIKKMKMNEGLKIQIKKLSNKK